MAVVAGLATWALWPDPPRQREYLDAKACLLTDEKGILSEPAKTVWSSMKDASVKTLVRVQYLQVTGEQTAENSESYLNTLAMSRCGLIVAAGRAPVEAVTRNAGGNPDIEFITVNGEIAAGNVLNLDASATEKLRKELQDRLEDLADVAS
jgi:basic membrane lipoprotein Med (substrate-binding protein (PBP1-ABC) superfamily)